MLLSSPFETHPESSHLSLPPPWLPHANNVSSLDYWNTGLFGAYTSTFVSLYSSFPQSRRGDAFFKPLHRSCHFTTQNLPRTSHLAYINVNLHGWPLCHLQKLTCHTLTSLTVLLAFLEQVKYNHIEPAACNDLASNIHILWGISFSEISFFAHVTIWTIWTLL